MLNKGLKPVLYDKDKAVSPIIATILLVAITVILASTLYLALGGFFKTTSSATPNAALSVTSGGSNNYTLTVGSVSSTSISVGSVEVEIFINGTGHFSSGLNSLGWHSIGSTGFSYNITTNPSAGYISSGMVIVVGPNGSPGGKGATVTGFELYYTGSPAGGLESGPVSA
jgi:flagellin-like protein